MEAPKRLKNELTSISYLPPYCRNADHEFFPSLVNLVRRSMVVCSVLTFIHFLCKYVMANTKERTFIMIKPDGVQRGLVGKIIQRFEEKGYKLVALKMVWVSLIAFVCSINYVESADSVFSFSTWTPAFLR